MNDVQSIFSYDEWKDAYEILEAQINLMNKNKHFNTLNLQYFSSLDSNYKEYVKSKDFFEKYINNSLFYGLEDVVFNDIYYMPKNRFAYRKMSYNSLVVRLISNAIGLYLFKVSEKFVNEFINNKESHISSRYGGKILYNKNGISIKQENLYYKQQYKEFSNELLNCINAKENKRIVLKLDIQDFYDNIKVNEFLKILESKLGYTIRKKNKYDKRKIENIKDFYKFIMNGQDGLPQSDNDIITSFVSSLYMKLIDIDIISIIKNMQIQNLKEYKIIQYCDDTYLILDFNEMNENNVYISVIRILEEISLKLVKKYNLKFNNKSNIFDLSIESNVSDLKKNIKINSQVEIELTKGEKPQKIFDDIISKIRDFSNQGINNADEESMFESLKKIYNDSVNAIIDKKDNLKILEEAILNLDLNKIFLSNKYIVTLASKNDKTKEKLLKYIENPKNENSNKFYYILEYIGKEDIGYLKNLNKINLKDEYKNILNFKILDKNSLGYMSLNSRQFQRLKLINNNIIQQIKYRRMNEVSKNYNIAFNHLVNEVKSIINNIYSPNTDEKDYNANSVKNNLFSNGYNINTIINVCNMFDRRNNNMISHSNGEIIDKEEYYQYKEQICNLLKEMTEKYN